MKNEMSESEKLRLQARETLNVRSMSMLEKCSEQKCLELARQIYEQRMLGFEVGYLESLLKQEQRYMFNMTRIFCGHAPESESEINN